MKKRMRLSMMLLVVLGSLLLCTGCSVGDRILEAVGNELQEARVAKHDYMHLNSHDKVYYIEKAINDNDVEKIYAIFSEDAKQEVGEEELRSQITDWMDAFDGNASLTFLDSSESSSVDGEIYDASGHVSFAYTVNGTEYECLIMAIDASSESSDYVGARYMLSIKEEFLESGEYTFKDYDTAGVAVID